jgi:3D (Asp-Asp-Asp) domain-containing protein
MIEYRPSYPVTVLIRSVALALSAALLAAGYGCDSSADIAAPETSGQFRLTYYWVVSPEDADLTTPLVDVLDIDDQWIASAPEDLVQQLALEGSGFLPGPDGRLINLACSCPYPDSRFFVVDTGVAPWGVGANDNPLVPFYSIAVDGQVIPLGTNVYVPAFDGIVLPDSSIHNGCFLAEDTSHSFSGAQIDVFAGTRSNYLALDAALNSLGSVSVVPGNCP